MSGKRFTFTINEVPPKMGTKHWAVIRRKKTEFTTLLRWLNHAEKCPFAKPGEHRSVHIEYSYRSVKRDTDNLHATCKIPLDALVRAGLLADDRPSLCTLTVSDEQSSKPYTKITITLD